MNVRNQSMDVISYLSQSEAPSPMEIVSKRRSLTAQAQHFPPPAAPLPQPLTYVSCDFFPAPLCSIDHCVVQFPSYMHRRGPAQHLYLYFLACLIDRATLTPSGNRRREQTNQRGVPCPSTRNASQFGGGVADRGCPRPIMTARSAGMRRGERRDCTSGKVQVGPSAHELGYVDISSVP